MGRRTTAARTEPPCRLLRFEATDGVALAGLLYEPRRATKRAIVFLHGTGGASIFDSGRTNLLGAAFTRRGFAYLPFNNRGAHLLRRLRARRGRVSKSVGGGMAYELIRECVFDIDGAVSELRARGYRELYLVGHSTGANKVAVYDHYKPRNPFRRYVLLAGGDDTGLFYEQLGARRYRSAVERAKTMIQARRGEELAPTSLSPMLLSWRALYDTANPDGDYNVFPFLEAMRGIRLGRRPLFRHVRGIRKPSLFVYGDSDEFMYGDVSACVATLAAATADRPNCEHVILADADHGFAGREDELARLLADWIES